MLEVFEEGRAEFVIVRIAAFEENQCASPVDEIIRTRVVPKPGQQLPGGTHAVPADFGEDFLERFPAGRLRGGAFQFVDARLFAGVAAVKRKERGALEQQITAVASLAQCCQAKWSAFVQVTACNDRMPGSRMS